MVKVTMNCSRLSWENGADTPLTTCLGLCDLLVGNNFHHYPDEDSITVDVSEENLPTAEALLLEAKIVYRVHTKHPAWVGYPPGGMVDYLLNKSA